MFLLDPLGKALLYVFMVGSMLGIGLKAGKAELLSVFRDRSWLSRMLIVNFILIPAAGILAAKLIPMMPEKELALIVLACAPGGISALQFLSKKKDPAALAYGAGTTALLSFLAIFITPFLIGLVIPEGMALTVPYGKAVLAVGLFMVLPLLVGILVHDSAQAAAARLSGPISLIGTLAFIGLMIKFADLSKTAKGAMGMMGLASIAVFVLISIAAGWLLGGPRPFTRSVLATASSMRNIALSLAIAVRSFDLAVLTPLVAFIAIMIPLNLLFLIGTKVAMRKKPVVS